MGLTMLFDPEPKKRIEDFFNMREELKSFLQSLRKGKLIVVTGLRRYGKTSLILTGLNASGLDYAFLDCRLLPSGMISINDFLNLLEDELNKKSWAKKLLQGVEGVSIGSVGLRFRGGEKNLFLRILEKMEGKVLVLDEAQELRRTSYRLDHLLAYIYDHLNVKIVVSGSQVGLLYRFLRIQEPEAPLFGRPYLEVRLKRLEPQKAEEFLWRGFEQEGIKVNREVVEEAVSRFDGVIGWLTYFGYSYTRNKYSISKILEKASKLSLSELNHALSIYNVGRKRYLEVLKIVASANQLRWSGIKRALEAKEGKIPNNTLSNILKNLMDQGFLEKTNEEYRITDPILKTGILKYL